MNFDFLKNTPEMKDLFTYCSETEKLVFSYPDSSIITARKSMEYIVKLVYGSSMNKDISGLTTFDIICDKNFIEFLDDNELVNAIHFIRKIGNQCVHGTSFDKETATDVLEKLHYVVGTICLYTGIIDSFDDFDMNCLGKAPVHTFSDTKFEVSEQLVKMFSQRFTSVRHLSELKKIIDVHKSTRKMNQDIVSGKAVSGLDSGNNTRTAFQIVAEWLETQKEFSEIYVDYSRYIISAKVNNNNINIAVKSGCPTLAFKNPDDSWNILCGIDYVIYAPDMKPGTPIFEQLRVFSAEEFYKMWDHLGLIRKKVSKPASARLEAMYGKGFKTDVNLHADSMAVQSFSNSNKKRTALQNEIINYPTLSQNGIQKITEKIK